MKTTFKMSILALSLGLMTVVSSCGEKKPAAEAVDTTKTVIEPMPDTTVKAKADTTAPVKEEVKK